MTDNKYIEAVSLIFPKGTPNNTPITADVPHSVFNSKAYALLNLDSKRNPVFPSS